MVVALWVIAACEIIRIAQNALQLRMYKSERPARENAYAEFVKSLKCTDSEFVRRLLEEFDKEFEDDKECKGMNASVPGPD